MEESPAPISQTHLVSGVEVRAMLGGEAALKLLELRIHHDVLERAYYQIKCIVLLVVPCQAMSTKP